MKQLLLTLCVLFVAICYTGAQTIRELAIEQDPESKPSNSVFLESCGSPELGAIVFSTAISGLWFEMDPPSKLKNMRYNRQRNEYVMCVEPTEGTYRFLISHADYKAVDFLVENVKKSGVQPLFFKITPKGSPDVTTNSGEATTITTGTQQSANLSTVKLKPINNRIELRLESCIRDGKSVSITYYLRNNTGRNVRMLDIGSSTQWCANNNGEYTTVVDDLGNNYTADYNGQKYNTYHELAGEKPNTNRTLNVTLPNGVWVKGVYTILSVNQAAKSFQVVNIAFDQYGGGNLCYDVSYGFKDLPITSQ